MNNTVPDTEFSQVFTTKMANAMEVSFHKYGPIVEAYPDKIDAIASLMLRLAKYQETGNTEYLVDVANFAMIEFLHPRHKAAHYKAEDSDASPGRVDARTHRITHRNNATVGANDKSLTAEFR